MILKHMHLMINAKISPEFGSLIKLSAQEFVNMLLKEIDMKPLGPINFAEAKDLDFPGQSFVQMITTSHCSLHYFDHNNGTNEIYFDLYSCKEFNYERVIKILDKRFGIIEWNGLLYTRANDEKPKVRVIQKGL